MASYRYRGYCNFFTGSSFCICHESDGGPLSRIIIPSTKLVESRSLAGSGRGALASACTGAARPVYDSGMTLVEPRAGSSPLLLSARRSDFSSGDSFLFDYKNLHATPPVTSSRAAKYQDDARGRKIFSKKYQDSTRVTRDANDCGTSLIARYARLHGQYSPLDDVKRFKNNK